MCMAQPRGSRIQELRERRGIKRTAFAKQLGISHPHLWGIECEENRPTSPELLYRIAAALDTTIDEVMVRIDNPPKSAADPQPQPANPTSHPVPPRPVPPPRPTKPRAATSESGDRVAS